MTIQDLIDSGSRNVKLGADRGSAFVYCGNIAECDIQFLDKEITDGYKQNIENAERRIKTLKAKPKDYESYKKNCETRLIRAINQYKNKVEFAGGAVDETEIEKIREEHRPTPKKHQDYLLKIETDLKYARSQKRSNGRKLKEYTTISSREIKETYPSITEKATIVIFEGVEAGWAWDSREYEEYRKGNLRKEDANDE